MHPKVISVDELPPGSKLYFCSGGTVVITRGPEDISRGIYLIHHNGRVIKPGSMIREINPGRSRFTGDIGYRKNNDITGTAVQNPEPSLIQVMFPALGENALSILDRMPTDMGMELATCLETHPRIHAGNYPVQYIALLLWQENGEAILDAIEREGGKITRQHLCDALGIPTLTYSMRKFIRQIELPILGKLDTAHFFYLIRSVIQQWHLFNSVFQHSSGLTIASEELDNIVKTIEKYPFLSRCKWFSLKQFRMGGFHFHFIDDLQRIYHFYVDNRKKSNLPLPYSASSIELFLTRHILGVQQLWNLMDLAEETLTEDAENWLTDIYLDDYIFPKLPRFENNQAFSLIRTAGQLRATAKKLQNCAAGYLHEAAEGSLLFFAYEYAPGKSPHHHFPDSPDHTVSGLLALDTQGLQRWKHRSSPMEWPELVVEFKGYRNAELGEHAWRDLYSLLHVDL